MKPLNLSDKERLNILEKFREDLMKNTRTLSGKLSWSYDIDKECLKNVNKPTVQFTLQAKAKMKTLVEQANAEIGWHGIVERLDKDTFLITDILVYPQTTSAATVTVDENAYAMWTMGIEDELFHKMRMQGHSHVNMAVFPSGTDQHLYDQYLDILKQDDFYIFIILNKRNEMFINIHDMAQNVLFEKEDITLKTVMNDGTLLEDWYKEIDATYIAKPAPVIHYSPASTIINRPTALEEYKAMNEKIAMANCGMVDLGDDYEDELRLLIERSKQRTGIQDTSLLNGRRVKI